MKRTNVQKLASLQQNTANIRNICILAHVDHGKTTLADALLASNGIISQRLAGKKRSPPEDSLSFTGLSDLKYYDQEYFTKRGSEEYLVNLIDSPGHIDFSSEVSTAVRLCDGAVVVVDVVEGVCPQTHAVLRQAWLEGIRPVLVLNKIDRLVVELKMTTEEAYQHLQRILEQVNAIMGELFASEVIAKSSQNTEKNSTKDEISADQVFDWSSGLEDTDDSHLYFCPDQGNVVFASAIDGWGFRLDHFSQLYAKKVGLSEKVLRKTLWGDFYVDTKAKSVKKGAQAKNKKNLFVQLVLDNIWKVYDAVLFARDKEMIGKIVKSLELKAPPHNTDPRAYLQLLFGQWLPLSETLLAMVCEQLPSPLQMNSERVEKLLASQAQPFDTLPPATQQLKDDFLACSSSDTAPVIVFVSKMFPVDVKSLPRNRARPLTAEELASKREALLQRLAARKAAAQLGQNADSGSSNDVVTGVQQLELTSTDPTSDSKAEGTDQVFIAFARIFSGRLQRGKKLFVLGPKHDPAKIAELQNGEMHELAGDFDSGGQTRLCHYATVEMEDLYMFMGRELEPLDEIPAGNILGMVATAKRNRLAATSII